MKNPALALLASTAILGVSTNAAAVGFALEHTVEVHAVVRGVPQDEMAMLLLQNLRTLVS